MIGVIDIGISNIGSVLNMFKCMFFFFTFMCLYVIMIIIYFKMVLPATSVSYMVKIMS